LPRVIFVSQYPDRTHIQAAFRAGAAAYVLKLPFAIRVTCSVALSPNASG
jgi:hypothetical protein